MENWSLLPDHFKKAVVKELDYKSRCRLRKCSRIERMLVDSSPVLLDNVDIQTRTEDKVYFGIGEERDSENILCDNSCNIDDVIRDFLLIFKSSESGIKKLVITNHYFKQTSEALTSLIASLLAEISDTIELKMAKLTIKNDSKALKYDTIRSFLQQGLTVLEELIKTEQSRSFNVVQIQTATTETLGNVAYSFCVYVDNLDVEFFRNCIQKYRSNCIPCFFFFQVFTLVEIVMTELFAFFDVPVINQPLDKDDMGNYFIHTQHFPLPWSQDHLLVVKFTNQMISGAICRKTSLSTDFNELEHL